MPQNKENRPPARSRTKSSKKGSDRTPQASTPPSDGVSRIRELEELLQETQNQLRTLQDSSQNSASPSHAVKDGSIPAPPRTSSITMKEIRTQLGFNKSKWSALRSTVRDCLRAARLDWSRDWKSQSTTKRGTAYNAIEADFPELRRFQGQWAVNRIAKNVWDNRKMYINCVDNPTTCVGRRAAQRHHASSSRSNSPVRNPSPPGSTPPSPRRSKSPTPGPSRQPPRARPLRAPSSSGSDSGDDLLNFSDKDNHGDEGQQEEEENRDGNSKVKKRARSGGEPPAKRRK